jgi:P-type Ca2+ transporter type 2C
VIRDGVEIRIPGREVVPGDIIILQEGDRIPADAVLLETINLTVDESLLTGEAMAVSKVAGQMNSPGTNQYMVFSGSMTIQGSGVARVVATGIHTQFGKIGTLLSGIEQQETRLQTEMKILIRKFSITAILICIAIVVLFYITRGNFIQSLLNGLAASMAILPEEFPVVLTIFLALGAWRLSQKKVLTRNPSSIETLGSTTVLCSDKTGTITQNKMEIMAIYNGEEIIYKNNFARNKKSLTAQIAIAFQACRDNPVDPMEKAIHKLYEQFPPGSTQEKLLLQEYPLSNSLLAMTRVLKNISDDKKIISAKGAPEAILSLCRLDKDTIDHHLKIVEQLADKGFRIIALADAPEPSEPLPKQQNDFNFQFKGFIGLEDPIREEVPQAIRECMEAGVKVMMITGDFPATAKSIARQIGLPVEGEIMTGEELRKISKEKLRERIKNVNIFARVLPEQKLLIVEALKANGEIVAMTGDGVNDAPALKAAHIGVAMGRKGTDVAREASSLVLLDDNFASIVSAIRSGRRIFDNLQKSMSYILAIHIPIIGLTMLPAFIPSLPLLLMPLHIIFMEMIIDPVCSIAFESEQEEKGIMQRPPRGHNESLFGIKQILFSIFQGLLLLAMVLMVYFLSIKEGHSEGEVRVIAFSSLIIGNVFLILTNISKTHNIISVFTEKNSITMVILLIVFIVLLLTIFVPYLQAILRFEFPGYRHFIPSIVGAVGMLLILESIKIFRSMKKRIYSYSI